MFSPKRILNTHLDSEGRAGSILDSNHLNDSRQTDVSVQATFVKQACEGTSGWKELYTWTESTAAQAQSDTLSQQEETWCDGAHL